MSEEQKKYKLTDETIYWEGFELHRIQALKTFGDDQSFLVVHAGDLGGWIESEDNLSQEGLCWVADNAKVYDHAEVSDDALIKNNAQVFFDARVYGKAWVEDNAEIYFRAEVYGDVSVHGNAKVFGYGEVNCNANVGGDAKVFCFAKVEDKAYVNGHAEISGYALINGEAWVSQHARVGDFANVKDKARIWGNAWVHDNAKISGNASVGDGAEVCGEAQIEDNAQVLGYAKVSEHAHVWEDAEVFGDADVCGYARVNGKAKVDYKVGNRGNTRLHDATAEKTRTSIKPDMLKTKEEIINEIRMWQKARGESRSALVFVVEDDMIGVGMAGSSEAMVDAVYDSSERYSQLEEIILKAATKIAQGEKPTNNN